MGAVPTSQIGTASGVASLDSSGHLPSGQVPDLSGTYVPRFATPPTDHTTYPAYIDTSTTPPVLKGWNGSAFVALGDGTTITDNGDGTATF